MAIINEHAPKWFGRYFDVNTQTWIYSDGSGGAYPEEMRLDLITALECNYPNGLAYLLTLWSWKDRLAAKQDAEEQHINRL